MGYKNLSKQYRAKRENLSTYSMTELHAIIKRVVKSENAFNALTFISGKYMVKYELIGTHLFITIQAHDKVWYQLAQLRYTDFSLLYRKG